MNGFETCGENVKMFVGPGDQKSFLNREILCGRGNSVISAHLCVLVLPGLLFFILKIIIVFSRFQTKEIELWNVS